MRVLQTVVLLLELHGGGEATDIQALPVHLHGTRETECTLTIQSSGHPSDKLKLNGFPGIYEPRR